MRTMFIKPGCLICLETQIAVDIFNKNHIGNEIEIVDITLPTFNMYRNMVVETFGEEVDFPAIIFEDIVKIIGGAGWVETLAYFNALHRTLENEEVN